MEVEGVEELEIKDKQTGPSLSVVVLPSSADNYSYYVYAGDDM